MAKHFQDLCFRICWNYKKKIREYCNKNIPFLFRSFAFWQNSGLRILYFLMGCTIINPSRKGFYGEFVFPLYKSISTGAQYVTPDSKIYCEKVKMWRFSSGNRFFCTKFVQLAVPGKRRNRVMHLQKRV